MRIRSAELRDFRNIASASLTFSERLNGLVGPNGQGKTNLLEGLYAISALRPLRSVPRVNLVRAGADTAHVSVSVAHERTGLVHEIAQDLRSNGRTLTKDGKPCDATSFLGALTVVAFTPDDLDISKGSPDGRRRFIDRAILNTRPAYLEAALRYARALKARNRLLADNEEDTLLDAYDETLARAGAAIAVARDSYVSAFAPRVITHFEAIASPAPPLSIRYKSTLREGLDASSIDNTAGAFLDALVTRRKRDRQRRSTSVGPHLDDLELLLGDAATRLRASQGQHRALVLAIKLAEITHLTDVLGEPPVLLLDDISSELDAQRSRQLFDAIAPLDAQVILTTTDEAQIPTAVLERLGPIELYDVSCGRLTRRA